MAEQGCELRSDFKAYAVYHSTSLYIIDAKGPEKMGKRPEGSEAGDVKELGSGLALMK